MRFDTYYNPDKDISPVVPGLGADISEVIATGVVEDTGLALGFNEIDENGKIIGRCNDIFEALEYTKRNAMKAQMKQPAASSVSTPSTPTGGEGE